MCVGTSYWKNNFSRDCWWIFRQKFFVLVLCCSFSIISESIYLEICLHSSRWFLRPAPHTKNYARIIFHVCQVALWELWTLWGCLSQFVRHNQANSLDKHVKIHSLFEREKFLFFFQALLKEAKNCAELNLQTNCSHDSRTLLYHFIVFIMLLLFSSFIESRA